MDQRAQSPAVQWIDTVPECVMAEELAPLMDYLAGVKSRAKNCRVGAWNGLNVHGRWMRVHDASRRDHLTRLVDWKFKRIRSGSLQHVQLEQKPIDSIPLRR
jgi:hypothetical protein